MKSVGLKTVRSCIAIWINYNYYRVSMQFSPVSALVNTCGVFCERLNLDCFKTVEAQSQKKIVIHRINCSENMMFSAPLRLLQHIYKVIKVLYS